MLHGCVTLVRRPRYPGRGWFSKDVGRACQKQPGVLARVHMHLRRGVCTCNGTRQSMSAVPSSWQDARRNMPNDLFPPSPIPPAPSRSSAPFCRISLCLSLPPSLSSLSSFHPLYLLSLSRSSAVPLSFESWLTRPRDCLPLAYRLMQLYVLRQFAPICVASSLSLSLSLSLHRACLFSASYSPLAPLPPSSLSSPAFPGQEFETEEFESAGFRDDAFSRGFRELWEHVLGKLCGWKSCSSVGK